MLYSKTVSSHASFVSLGELTSEEPCYGTSATAIKRTDDSQPKYIRITDFDDFGIEDNHEYVTTENYSEKHLLREGDILFARTGATVGKTYFYDGSIGKAIFAGYCIRFRFDKNKVLPKYVYWYTKTSAFLNWVNGIQRPAGQPNINKEEYKSFQIPVPDYDTQIRLTSILDTGMKKRTEKYTLYSSMIDSIPKQIEEELGVQFSFPKDRLCSSVHFSSVLNNHSHRLDPKCFSPYYETLRQELSQTKHKTYKLIELVTDVTSGDWGEDPINDNPSYLKCLVLRATEFDNLQNISVNKDKAKYRSIPISSIDKQKIEIGDILVEKSGGSKDQPVGRVVYIDSLQYDDSPVSYSNYLTKLKINTELVDPYYLFEYLRFVYAIGLTEVMQNQTNGIRNLIMEEYLDLTVIVPSNNKEIGNRIKAIRNDALMYKKEAEQEWQEARKQFEKALLVG